MKENWNISTSTPKGIAGKNVTRISSTKHAIAFLITFLVSFNDFSISEFFNFRLLGNKNQTICWNIDEACVEGVKRSLMDETSDSFKNCDCLPDCNIIDYSHMRTDARMASESAGKFIDVNGTIPMQGLVSIYFGSDEYSGFKRYASYNTVSLLSNIGGFLGLFLGISLFSFIEVIYFYTLRFFNNLWM